MYMQAMVPSAATSTKTSFGWKFKYISMIMYRQQPGKVHGVKQV